MAITPTGAIYKTLTFDGESSGTYGVYITGNAVFNAPERAVEMITIPGRNGAFALDQGRFENIEVTYPAGIFADNEADFAEAISEFRNFLCSRKGYVRLTDDYNPDEYRLAVYKSGLEVEPSFLRAGEFDITFECKPQRFLTSGEEAVSVTSGDTITNPTLFEASPLLEVEGEGAININGYNLNLDVPEYGNLELASEHPLSDIQIPQIITLNNTTDLIIGDTITASSLYLFCKYGYAESTAYLLDIVLTSCTGPEGCSASVGRSSYMRNGVLHTGFWVKIYFANPAMFAFGTAETKTVIAVITASVKNQTNIVVTVTVNMAYDGNDTITFTKTDSYSRLTPDENKTQLYYQSITGYSTKIYNFGSIYCDCDTGEIYRIENGVPISMNHLGSFGSDLPIMSPGANAIIYDNTFTDFKIMPRWWKI